MTNLSPLVDYHQPIIPAPPPAAAEFKRPGVKWE